MIKELMHDPLFLAGKSEVATKEDLQIAKDLLDTLMAHRESCVGMAANMIGVQTAFSYAGYMLMPYLFGLIADYISILMLPVYLLSLLLLVFLMHEFVAKKDNL